MPSVACGRVGRNEGDNEEAGDEVPAAVEGHRQRALTAALDGARFQLTRLVRTVADRLTIHPSSVSLATLELEVRDALLALGHDLLTELVRLRGTGDRGPSYVCPCGVRLVRKEVATLQQRTWFGTLARRSELHVPCSSLAWSNAERETQNQ